MDTRYLWVLHIHKPCLLIPASPLPSIEIGIKTSKNVCRMDSFLTSTCNNGIWMLDCSGGPLIPPNFMLPSLPSFSFFFPVQAKNIHFTCFLKQKEEQEAQASVPVIPSADRETQGWGPRGHRSGNLSRMLVWPLVCTEWLGGEEWHPGFCGEGSGPCEGEAPPCPQPEGQNEHLENEEKTCLCWGLRSRSLGLH